ncbi:MAG: VOC family protein [Pseudanabaenales cyanobacterium]|nr:VOC family protein [Pseudanabaenales cyanobacterium]
MQTRIDHLVIGAADLSQGIAYVKECLGVDTPYGGRHVNMGTHNHLMRLGDHIFLEVMAINPDVESPERPRWFGLDDPYVRWRIESQPALLTWVVNTKNIAALLQQARVSFGKAELMSRGDLSWYFGLPDDGGLLAGGMLPYVIEWRADSHSSTNMADRGCLFQGLEIYHAHPSWLQSVLASIGAAELVKIHALPKNRTPYLVASINTPKGTKELRSDVALGKVE